MNNKEIYNTILIVTTFLYIIPIIIMESYINYGELNHITFISTMIILFLLCCVIYILNFRNKKL